MTKITTAIRNAIAFADYFGSFAKHTSYNTRIAAQGWNEDKDLQWVVHNDDYLNDHAAGGLLRFNIVTAAGRAVAEQGDLAKCLKWLADNGYKVRSGHQTYSRSKPRYITGFSDDEGREAWISDGQRVYGSWDRETKTTPILFEVRQFRRRAN